MLRVCIVFEILEQKNWIDVLYFDTLSSTMCYEIWCLSYKESQESKNNILCLCTLISIDLINSTCTYNIYGIWKLHISSSDVKIFTSVRRRRDSCEWYFWGRCQLALPLLISWGCAPNSWEAVMGVGSFKCCFIWDQACQWPEHWLPRYCTPLFSAVHRYSLANKLMWNIFFEYHSFKRRGESFFFCPRSLHLKGKISSLLESVLCLACWSFLLDWGTNLAWCSASKVRP